MCPLNILQSFHCTSGFPPDLLHDHMEGVMSQDLLGIIRILSLKKWFSIKEYNKDMKLVIDLRMFQSRKQTRK